MGLRGNAHRGFSQPLSTSRKRSTLHLEAPFSDSEGCGLSWLILSLLYTLRLTALSGLELQKSDFVPVDSGFVTNVSSVPLCSVYLLTGYFTECSVSQNVVRRLGKVTNANFNFADGVVILAKQMDVLVLALEILNEEVGLVTQCLFTVVQS